MSGRRRYRFERVEVHGGRRVAVVTDLGSGELVRVYFQRGRWRRWEARHGDRMAAPALAAVARRGLASGIQERIGEPGQELEELAPEPTAEKVRLFEPAPPVVPGQLGLGEVSD